VIFKSDTAMEITRLEKQSFLNYFGGMLGSIFGIMGSFAAFMGIVEVYTDKLEKKQDVRKNTKKCLYRARKLDAEFGKFFETHFDKSVYPANVTCLEVDYV
jgi:hypothetical protein